MLFCLLLTSSKSLPGLQCLALYSLLTTQAFFLGKDRNKKKAELEFDSPRLGSLINGLSHEWHLEMFTSGEARADAVL